MSRINLKTDYKDGQILYGDELNVNNTVAMQGVNDNFERISNLSKEKADVTYVNNVASEKVDEALLDRKIQELDYLKANKSDLAKKANQSDVDLKANKSDVTASLEEKADIYYVNTNLNNKVSKTDFNNALDTKANITIIGDLDNLNTSQKGTLVDAINSVNRETLPIATVDNVGLVKPDGTTVTIDQDGTLHAVAGGGTGSGTTDYNALSNKPIINGVEIKGNVSLDDLKLMSKSDINSNLANKANKNDVYTKEEIDINVLNPLAAKANKSYVDDRLSNKADSSNVYNKSTVDELLNAASSETNAKLLNKVDRNETYTKEDINDLVKSKADNLSFYSNLLQLKAGDELIGDPIKIEVATSDIIISDEQPSLDDKFKIWIDEGEVDNLGSEVVNSMSGNETRKAPSIQAVNKAIGIVGWSNPSPNGIFPAQAITLNEANYDEYEIEFTLVSNSVLSKTTGRISKTNRAYLDYVGGSGLLVGYTRSVENISGKTINFGDALAINSGIAENARCIPQRVILYIK